jgi:hypothetical protein
MDLSAIKTAPCLISAHQNARKRRQFTGVTDSDTANEIVTLSFKVARSPRLCHLEVAE